VQNVHGMPLLSWRTSVATSGDRTNAECAPVPLESAGCVADVTVVASEMRHTLSRRRVSNQYIV
jgi:hypothetical protein